MYKRKDDKKKKAFLGIVIAFIMVSSMVGYMWGSSAQRMKYNSYKFIRTEKGYLLQSGDKQVIFNYFPEMLENMEFPQGASFLLQNKVMFYLTYAPNSTYKKTFSQIQYNIASILWDLKEIYVQPSFTLESEFDIPVITCENSTIYVPVVEFRKSNQTKAVIEGNCLVAEVRDSQEAQMLAERIVYSVLGVME